MAMDTKVDAEVDAEQAQRMLAASGLPASWRGRQRFVVLQTGFGFGGHFLALWQAWRSDPQRCRHLCVLALAPHPPTRQALRQAHAPSSTPGLAQALIDAWPELTPNVHALDFEDGRVQLLLAMGNVGTLLPALRAQVDAFQLPGPVHPGGAQRQPDPADQADQADQAGAHQAHQAPGHQPVQQQQHRDADTRWLKALARKAAADATLAGTGMPDALRRGLISAGFALHNAPDAPPGDAPGSLPMTTARFAPRPTVRARPAAACSHGPAAAIVIGAGIAGAAAAQALARNGVSVRVFDRHAAPAQEASGNPAGLFHGTVHAGDGVHARLFRAAALHAQRSYAQVLQAGVPGSVAGLLRLGADLPAMQAVLHAQQLPPGYVQALDATSASQHAGVPLASPAWLYPGGGWVAPARLIAHQLRQPGITFVGGMHVARIAAVDGDQGRIWHLHDTHGRLLAQTPLLVLANAADATQLLHALGHGPWPLQQIRGQVTWWPTTPGEDTLRMPLAGDGYAIPLRVDRHVSPHLDQPVDPANHQRGAKPSHPPSPPPGDAPGSGLLCGATREAVAPSAATAVLRQAEQRANVQGFQQLTGLQAADSMHWQGRVGWRLQADDRLPVAGAVPLAHMAAGQRLDQARLLPRDSGLFVLTALGARGLTLAPLLARLVAAQATGAPWPLEQDLADAIDPGRWVVRAARQAGQRPLK